MSRSKEIVHQVSFYSTAAVLTQLVSVVVAVLMRRFLGPLQVGVWSLVQIVLVYTEYVTLGIMQVIPRDIPFYNGKGEPAKADRVKNVAFSFTLMSSLIVSGGLLAACFFFRASWREEVFYAFLFASGLVLLQRFNDLLISLLRAYKRFDVAGRQIVLSALVNGLLVGVLASRFKLYGFLWGMVLSFVFNILYIFRHEAFRFRFVGNWREAYGIALQGLPLMLLSLMTTLFMTADKIVISKFMGLEQLGLYSIAVMTASYVFSFPNAIGIVMIPNILEKFGERENESDLRRYLSESNRVYGVLMPVLIGMAWFWMPVAVRLLLPQFTEGLEAMKYLALGAYFLALGQAYSHFLFAAKRNLSLLANVAGLCVLAVVFDLIAVRSGGGLAAVAAATAAAMFCHFSVFYFTAAPRVWTAGEAFAGYLKILGGFAAMSALLFSLEAFVRLPGPYWTALARSAVYLAVYSPFLFALVRRFGIGKK